MILEKIYNYTLEEAFEVEPYTTNETLANLLTSLGLTFTPSQTSLIEELWKKVINKYYEGIAFSSCKILDETELTNMKKKFITKFLNMYEDSKDKYETLINIFNAKKEDLFKEVESSTENEVFFNDTPQVEGGVFKGLEYTSNYTKTKTTNKSDLNTPMNRLIEIQNNLLKYWGNWLEMFERLFIESQEGSL